MAFVDIIFVSTFRATFSFQHSELLFRFGVQSHGFGSTFRVIISSISAFRAITHLHYNIQSHYLSSFGVQSHVCFIWRLKPRLRSAFRAITSSISAFKAITHLRHSDPLLIFVRRSKPCLLYSALEPRLRSAFKAITSSISAFRVITHLRYSIQSHYLSSFGIQSHVLLHSTFKPTSSFGVQSHYIIHFGVQSYYLS